MVLGLVGRSARASPPRGARPRRGRAGAGLRRHPRGDLGPRGSGLRLLREDLGVELAGADPAARCGDRSGGRAPPNSISEDGRGSGEPHLVEVDKADGPRLAAEHLGVGIEDTVAVGDGPNDLGILRAAGTGVAIRGSRPEVLAAADMEVAPPSEHGVEEAFARLGML
ncbi:HAD hydrolase family protein [Brachybacterium sp. GPGPB12]|uniref:HAD hydrolase family protein n=1 Tax=Brachybacterium sp. GPGPB12 TaxID=3023517 RepID=UPI0031342CAB